MIYIYKSELIRVVDGDTVDLIVDLGFDTFRHERFRLYGIDAPEMRTKEGKEAKKWLEDALMPLESIYVQTIQLSTKAKRDKYGGSWRCFMIDSRKPGRLWPSLGRFRCFRLISQWSI